MNVVIVILKNNIVWSKFSVKVSRNIVENTVKNFAKFRKKFFEKFDHVLRKK